MKITKVENISGIKLEFFLKQDKEDIRVTLKPGEKTWCDYGTTTKSMILYERKSLITVMPGVEDPITDAYEIVAVQPPTPSSGQLFFMDIKYEEKNIEEVILEVKKEVVEPEKKYKGKKRGRKKKRGPKTGSKRKKPGDSSADDSTNTEV